MAESFAARGTTGARTLVELGERVLRSPAFVWGVIAGGSLLRVAQYFSGRNLWLDESFISINIVTRPVGRLFDTLYFGQAAPPGFLLVERLAYDAFGSTEDVLRLEPLLVGIAALPLFFLVARQVLGPAAAAAALVLFALLEGPIAFSSQVKQYSDDVCFTLAVLAVALPLAGGRLTRRDAIRLAAVGAVAMWFSHAVVFVLAGIGGTLLAHALRSRERWRWERLVAVGAAWCVSLGALYAVNISKLPAGLGAGIGSFFQPIPPHSLHDVSTIASSFKEFLEGELWLNLPSVLVLVAALVGLVGIVDLGRRNWMQLSMLLAPVPITAVASGVANYPWGGRFTLFFAPLPPLLIVAGAKAVAARRTPVAAAVAFVVVAAVAAPSLKAAVRHLESPRKIEEIVPAVRTLEADYRPGDSLYVNFDAQFALRWYGLERHMGERLPLVRDPRVGKTGYALLQLPPRFVIGTDTIDMHAVPRRKRVWVLLSHFEHTDPKNFLARLDAKGRRLMTKTDTGVTLALYDLAPGAR